MPALRVIQTLSAGVEWVAPFVPTGVTLCDAGRARDINVAEWVLAAILASIKGLPELRDRQREHVWDWRQSGELAGSTVMILGYGAIGAAVEARLAPFGVEPDPASRAVNARACTPSGELASLLGDADILVVLLPLTPATTGLLDARICSRACARGRCSSTRPAGRSSTWPRCSSCCRRAGCGRRWTLQTQSRCHAIIRCGTHPEL